MDVYLSEAGDPVRSYGHYETDVQGRPPQYWTSYSPPTYCPPLSNHTPSCGSPPAPQPPEQYCPRVVKRRSAPSQRLEKDSEVTGMSAYPGEPPVHTFCQLITDIQDFRIFFLAVKSSDSF